MSDRKPPGWHLALMIVWFGLLCARSGLVFLMGLMFGSEAYRGNPMPIMEWLIIAGPLAVSTALMIGTIILWNKGRYTICYSMCAASLIALPSMAFFAGVLGV